MKNARAERVKLLFLSLNMQICDVCVAVAVVVAKAPKGPIYTVRFLSHVTTAYDRPTT